MRDGEQRPRRRSRCGAAALDRLVEVRQISTPASEAQRDVDEEDPPPEVQLGEQRRRASGPTTEETPQTLAM